MIDPVLKQANEALENWSKTITTKQFIEDHKRLGLTKDKTVQCDHEYKIWNGVEVCRHCTAYKLG